MYSLNTVEDLQECLIVKGWVVENQAPFVCYSKSKINTNILPSMRGKEQVVYWDMFVQTDALQRFQVSGHGNLQLPLGGQAKSSWNLTEVKQITQTNSLL